MFSKVLSILVDIYCRGKQLYCNSWGSLGSWHSVPQFLDLTRGRTTLPATNMKPHRGRPGRPFSFQRPGGSMLIVKSSLDLLHSIYQENPSILSNRSPRLDSWSQPPRAHEPPSPRRQGRCACLGFRVELVRRIKAARPLHFAEAGAWARGVATSAAPDLRGLLA